MRRKALSLFSFTMAVFCFTASAVFAQQQLPEPLLPFQRLYTYGVVPGAETRKAEIMRQSAAAATIPLWGYTSQASRDGSSYSGVMVGGNPFFHGHRTASITTFLIPVKLIFQSDGSVFDPTANNACAGGKVITLIQNSPVFQSTSYIMNGIDVSNTQYVDAFERASFWSNVGGTPHHTVLSPVVTVAAQIVTVQTANGLTQKAPCGKLGAIDINWWDPLAATGSGSGPAENLLAGLASSGVGSADLAIFVFNSVVLYNSSPSNCCYLGYHDGFFTSGGSGPLQTYATASWDASGAFGGDISTTSHEVAEWMNDPLGSNLVPAWGHVGQVDGCQNNLEVADPLTGTLFPSVTLSGFTYNPQELAFFSWFFGAPSIGAGGAFSNNGTFTKDAGQVCF